VADPRGGAPRPRRPERRREDDDPPPDRRGRPAGRGGDPRRGVRARRVSAAGGRDGRARERARHRPRRVRRASRDGGRARSPREKARRGFARERRSREAHRGLRRPPPPLRGARRGPARSAGARDPLGPRRSRGALPRAALEPLGGMEDARRPGAAPALPPRPAAPRRADEPPRPRGDRLARVVPVGMGRRVCRRLARPVLPQSHGARDRRARARQADDVSRRIRRLPRGARGARRRRRGGREAAEGGDRAGGALHRAVPVQGDEGEAGPVARALARQDRENRGAEQGEEGSFRIPARPALGRRGRAPGRATGSRSWGRTERESRRS